MDERMKERVNEKERNSKKDNRMKKVKKWWKNEYKRNRWKQDKCVDETKKGTSNELMKEKQVEKKTNTIS